MTLGILLAMNYYFFRINVGKFVFLKHLRNGRLLLVSCEGSKRCVLYLRSEMEYRFYAYV